MPPGDLRLRNKISRGGFSAVFEVTTVKGRWMFGRRLA
jgi:hypothetical protein